MSISGISSSSSANYRQSIQNNFQQFRPEFQQVGQDLQSGGLSPAQQDFAKLQQLGPQTNSTSTSQSANPVAQQFNQLAQDLQSGNLSAAQLDYSKIQQDLQSQTQGAQGHPHHHHGGGEGSTETSQLFSQLGQDLQSGNLSSAQQAYSTLLQDFQQVGLSTGINSVQPSSPSSSNTLSVAA
jgi:hypothetical protein